MKKLFPWLMILLIPAGVLAAENPKLEEQVRSIAQGLRCVVCQNLSVADSPSEMAQQMRGIIREQLQEGKSPEEINAYFVSKYGEWVLLAPKPKGFSLLLWVLPYAALIVGIVFVIFIARRWVRKNQEAPPRAVDQALIDRVREEVTEGKFPHVEEETPEAGLLREQARLYTDLRELGFDFQAGKLSEADYHYLRRELENQAATALKEIESLAPSRPRERAAAPRKERAQKKKASAETARTSYRGWQIAVGGAFLLLFGVTVGVFLTQSLRPRTSGQDSITGGFLTGTGPGGLSGNSPDAGTGIPAGSAQDLPVFLSQGRAAYQRQDLPAAIEAFKSVLKIDPNQSEAHAYMGLILSQAGHGDGALMAFNRALLNDPDQPIALWGKGMHLYHSEQDFSGALKTMEKLLKVMPPGKEREQIQKTVAEIAKLAGRKKEASKEATAVAAADEIHGTVAVDPKLKAQVDNRAVLFIIARSANSTAGPPLAVLRIDRPTFPVTYSLGPNNVMMAGMSLAGKVSVSALLDKDGNAMTKESGNLRGEYGDPVEAGTKKVDIVIDQMM